MNDENTMAVVLGVGTFLFVTLMLFRLMSKAEEQRPTEGEVSISLGLQKL